MTSPNPFHKFNYLSVKVLKRFMTDISLEGKVIKGLRIASGMAEKPQDPRLNFTIMKQKPFFERHGIPRITETFNGTLNVDISPKKFKIVKPDHEIECEWENEVREKFWFVDGKISFGGKKYDAYVYYPCPSELKNHSDNIVEILTEKIEGIKYGDRIVFETSGEKIEFY